MECWRGLRRQTVEELEELKAIEATADNDEIAARVKNLREKKEALLGLASENVRRPGADQERASVAVH